MKLTVLTYNTLFAGRDGADTGRAEQQVGIIRAAAPDVFLMQEARGFDANGSALLHALEARIGMRGFLALAPRTGQHVAIFIRPWLVPVSFDADNANFHHALARLTVRLPDGTTLVLMSTHLCPNGAVVRQREAAYVAVQAAPDVRLLLTGDFNSASPHDAEPGGFDALPAHHRTRYLAEDLQTADRTVLAGLEAAGWVDICHRLGGNALPTVPTAGFSGTEFATMRCDYILATPALAAGAERYEVIGGADADSASDHYPVLARFDLGA